MEGIDKVRMCDYNKAITEYLKFAVLYSLKRKPVQIRCSPNSTVIDDEQGICHWMSICLRRPLGE